jgi:hypothetical protein
MIDIKVTLGGISPLICNRFTEAAQKAVSSSSSSSFQGSKGTPREQAEPKLYTDSKGRPVLPSVNLMASLVEAGRFIKSGRSKLSTTKSSLVPAGLAIPEIELLITPKKWEVDSRPVVVPATGGRIMCHRPRFDVWRVSLTLEVDETLFSERLIRELVDIAGKRIGVGDFRPSRRGPFGRFEVLKWN